MSLDENVDLEEFIVHLRKCFAELPKPPKAIWLSVVSEIGENRLQVLHLKRLTNRRAFLVTLAEDLIRTGADLLQQVKNAGGPKVGGPLSMN